MKIFKIILWTIVIIILFVGFFKWSAHRDQVMFEAYEKYEACVKAEYGTTPSAWYAEHGETPPCSTDIN